MDRELCRGWRRVKVRHLADRIGVSEPTMYVRARELGLHMRCNGLAPEKKRKLRQWWPFMGRMALAKRLGISRHTMYDCAREMGLTIDRRVQRKW